jgi:hypothetical protein
MAVQSELDDLLMVLGDLEEKASKYKVMIKRYPLFSTICSSKSAATYRSNC